MTVSVAHVITRMIVGGAQENTLSSVQGLSAMDKYEVSLLTGAETGTEGDLLTGLEPRFDLRYVPGMVRSINPMQDARALRWLYDHFKMQAPEIVHTHSSKAGVLGRVAARMAHVRVVVHTLHSLVFHDYQPAPVRMTYRQVKRAMVPFTDHYVSVSDDIRERAVAAGVGKAEQHSTVRSGFNTVAFEAALVPQADARAQLGLPHDRLIVGVVGRLFPLKGHEEVLAAAPALVRKHPEVLFAFVGGGPLEPQLKEIVDARRLSKHVTFVGRLAPEVVPVAFSAFDILAHASLREGLARVIPQGVLARVPVVCYDLDGSREVVDNGGNGFLVQPRDTGRMADRLGILAADERLRKELGGKQADRIRREFSVDEMVRRLDELYGRLLGERASVGLSSPRRSALKRS